MAKKKHNRKPPVPPRVEIDPDQLRNLMAMMPRLVDVAGFFKCSIDTIESRIREIEGQADMTYPEFRDRYLAPTRLKLQQKAIGMGLSGNTKMLTFALKNVCEWTERTENTNFNFDDISDEEIAQALKNHVNQQKEKP